MKLNPALAGVFTTLSVYLLLTSFQVPTEDGYLLTSVLRAVGCVFLSVPVTMGFAVVARFMHFYEKDREREIVERMQGRDKSPRR